MSQENNFIPSQEPYKPLSAFHLFVKSNFPFIESTYEALDNYGLYCKVVEYLNNVISNENAVESNVTDLYNAFVSLNTYVSDYFDNLDVQEEINNKLDEMAESGELEDLLREYLQYLDDSYQQKFSEQASVIQQQNNEINALSSRMDTFSHLQSGSTTGDAELADIRVGYTGHQYDTAGDSVRDQIKNIHTTFGADIYTTNMKYQTYSYVNLPFEILANTEIYYGINSISGVVPSSIVLYGFINGTPESIGVTQNPQVLNIINIKTTKNYESLRLVITYPTTENYSNINCDFIFGLVNDSLFSKLAYVLGGTLTTNKKFNNTSVTSVNNSNISSIIPSLNLNDLHDLKIYYFNAVSGLQNQPMEYMNGIFISFPYNIESEFGTMQIFMSNNTNALYIRTNKYREGGGANWLDWGNCGSGLRPMNMPTVINNTNVSNYVLDLDLNNVHDFVTYYFYNVNTLDNQPVSNMDGVFYSICFNNLQEPGTIQYYIDRTNKIYTRICHGASTNPQWSTWKELYSTSDSVQYNTNLKTYKIFKKVVCVGDSYTAGYINITGTPSTYNEDYAWPHYMETSSGNTYINCGVSGANTSTWQSNAGGLPKATTAGKAQAYIVGLGINDSSTNPNLHLDLGVESDIGTNNNTYYGNLSKIVRELKNISPDAKILLLTRPQSGTEYNNTYNKAVRDIAAAYETDYDVTLVDLYTNYNDLFTNSSLTGDGVAGHYTAIGYEQFAEILSYCLSDVINNNISKFQDVYSIPIE